MGQRVASGLSPADEPGDASVRGEIDVREMLAMQPVAHYPPGGERQAWRGRRLWPSGVAGSATRATGRPRVAYRDTRPDEASVRGGRSPNRATAVAETAAYGGGRKASRLTTIRIGKQPQ